MTITLEYDQTEQNDQQQATESEQFNFLRHIHLVAPAMLIFSGLLLIFLSSLVLIVRDLETGSVINRATEETHKLRQDLAVWAWIGLGTTLSGLAFLATCKLLLRFRQPQSELRNFLQALASQQQLGEWRDPSIFNSNQHFRRFPLPQQRTAT